MPTRWLEIDLPPLSAISNHSMPLISQCKKEITHNANQNFLRESCLHVCCIIKEALCMQG